MSRESRIRQAYLREQNKAYGLLFVRIPEEQWPKTEPRPVECFRNSQFLVQIFAHEDGASRMTICRTVIGDDGMWKDGIAWEELQSVKNQCGYAHCWAVEIFPPSQEVVNVANMRHLWLLPEAPSFAWKRKERAA